MDFLVKKLKNGLREHLENKNPADDIGNTPLHLAAKYGCLEIVKYIADHLEDKNPADHWANTPLHLAARKGNLKIV